MKKPQHVSSPSRPAEATLPVTDPGETRRQLLRLVIPGALGDKDLQRRIARIGERFRAYAGTIPFGLWGEGLAITAEMRAVTNLLLPQEELRRAFQRLLRLSLTFDASLEGTPLQRAASWSDCLERLAPPFREADPARLLAKLAADSEFRLRFLFSLFVPRHHGASADRYPAQGDFLARRLGTTGRKPGGVLRCFDAACGAGEGTYGLARLLLKTGLAPDSFLITGSSRDPLEIFAAVHGFFPHDPQRQEAFRRIREELRPTGALERIRFTAADLTTTGAYGNETFDVILCNGILGGPFMHERQTLEQVVAGLADRLAAGGIILAADRFHDGWKRVAPPAMLGDILAGKGLSVVAAGEGIAGIRGE